MSIPISQGLIESGCQFIQRFKASSFERQRTQLLPPRLNEIEPAGILGNELDLHFGPGCQSQFHLSRGVNTEIVFDDQPAIRWEFNEDLLQQLNMTGTVSSWTHQNRCLPGGRFKRPMRPQLTSATIVRFKGRPIETQFPFFARVGLDRQRSQLIDANDPCSWD